MFNRNAGEPAENAAHATESHYILNDSDLVIVSYYKVVCCRCCFLISFLDCLLCVMSLEIE